MTWLELVPALSVGKKRIKKKNDLDDGDAIWLTENQLLVITSAMALPPIGCILGYIKNYDFLGGILCFF